MTANGKKTLKTVTFFALAAGFVVAAVLYYLPDFYFVADGAFDAMIRESLVRFFAVGITFYLVLYSGAAGYLRVKGNFFKHALICLPCVFVALANFPFHALISGGAAVERADLLPLLVLKCVLTAVLEELLFRVLLFDRVYSAFDDKRGGAFVVVALTGAAFGLFHLVNLLSGAGIVSVLTQVGYTILIGCMLSFVMLETGNVYFCVALHAVFNFGGELVPMLGSGVFQDAVFWWATVVCGAVCAVHVVFLLFMKEKARKR